MRPPSKHGLERKYKPWRKGKSDKKARTVCGGSDKRPTNASLKNRLRGQKRLLQKLQKQNVGGNDGEEKSKNDNKKEMIDGVQQSIIQLEKDIASYEAREREKKNAAK